MEDDYEGWEDKLVERVAKRVREDFKKDAGRWFTRTLLLGAGRIAAYIGLWEVGKLLGPKALELVKFVFLG